MPELQLPGTGVSGQGSVAGGVAGLFAVRVQAGGDCLSSKIEIGKAEIKVSGQRSEDTAVELLIWTRSRRY
jgi:hypothetical protein